MVKSLIRKHKAHWQERDFFISGTIGFLLLAFSFYLNNIANNYIKTLPDTTVSDLILSNTRVYNVNFVLTYGVLLFAIISFVMVLNDPASIPFLFKSMALFITVRAIFMISTHLGQFQPQIPLTSGSIFDLLGGGNGGGLFFSGHTGLPFLFALIFWPSIRKRIFFLAGSAVFGTSMLLGHLHYTIDVLAAFFITYAIYKMSSSFFKKDLHLLNSELSAGR